MEKAQQTKLITIQHLATKYQGNSYPHFAEAVTGPILLIGPDQPKPQVCDIGALFNGDPLLLGRSLSCDIPVFDNFVSRQQAGIHFNGRTWTLIDYKSSNGTFFPDRLPPAKPVRLAMGSIFTVGPELLCQFIDVKTLYMQLKAHDPKSKPSETTRTRRRPTQQTTSIMKSPLESTQHIKILPAMERDRRLQEVQERVELVRQESYKRSIPKHWLRQQKIEPRSLRDFFDEIRNMNYDEFMIMFTEPFLILLTVKSDMNADTNFETIVLSEVNIDTKLGNVVFWLLASERGHHSIRLGRDEGNDIVVRHPSVSRIHASFKEHDDEWVIRDLQSTNGVYVDGELIQSKTFLGEEAIVRFGGDCSLKFATVDKMWELLQILRDNPLTGL